MFSFQYFFFYLSLWSYYYCNDLSLSFYFIFLPRRTSNLREVRFGEVAVLKQISTLHHKNSWKFSEYLFDLRFLVHMTQVISKLSLVLLFLIWATEGPQKNQSLSAVLFYQILPLFVFASWSLFLSFFYHGTFAKVATVAYDLMVGIFEFETEPKE
jgi:hypothetical protein